VPFPTRLRPPELPRQAAWINALRPLGWAELRGKFVLLDFWTFGCINCRHMIPTPKRLEAARPKNLVVVGVHSAKFQSERDLDNLKEAVARYGLQHPLGVACCEGRVYVADTNNHAIRMIELKGDYRVTTLRIAGLEPARADTSPARGELPTDPE